MEPRYVIGGLTAGALVLCWGGKWGGSSPPPSKRAEAGMLGEKSVYRDLVASSSNVRSLAFKPQGGGKIPAIGFGTATLFGNQCKVAVTDAIKLGYRHIDTALLYANHEAVGAGIRASGVPRDQLWVTSKIAFFPPKAKGLWMYEGIGPAGRKTSPDSVGKNNEKGGEAASVDLALKQLGMDSVDLLLIHNPASSRPEYNAACMPHFYELIGSLPPVLRLPISGFWRLVNTLTGPGGMSSASRDVRAASWKALEAAQKAGKCKYIGVSNYPPALLEEMKGYATVLPAVNQLELHPRFSSPALRKLAKEMGIVLTGYGSGNSVIIEKSPVVAAIAREVGKTPIQVVLRWTVQSGVAVVPRSGNKAHIRENLDILSWALSEQQMAAMEALNQDHPYYWDPIATVG